MKLINKLTYSILILNILLIGCTTLPTHEVMKSEVASFKLPKLPSENQALVYVVRPSGIGGLIRFNVFVDDEEPISEMGYTRSSQYIYFTVKPGKRKLFSKAENTAELEIDAKAGDVIFVKQDPSMGLIMARNSINNINEIEGTYHVKTLQLGTILKTEK